MRTRAVTSAFQGWEAAAQRWVKLYAGALAQNCRIGFNKRLGPQNDLSRYTAEFEVDGLTYWAPLHTFQARTEALADFPTEAPLDAFQRS